MLNYLKNCFNPLVKLNDNLSLNDIFKPIYSVLTFLGLFPYSVKFNLNKQKYTVISKSIYVNSIYGVSVVLTVCLFLVLHFKEVFLTSELSSITEVLLNQINYILELTTLIIFITVTYVNAFLNRNKYVKILITIISTWKNLSKNNDSVSVLKSLYFKVNVLVKGCLFVVVVMQICLNFLQGDRVWRMILMFISYNFPQTIQFIMIIFYYVVIMMLVTLLANIEKHITQLQINRANEDKSFVQMKTITPVREMELFYSNAFEAKTNINLVFQYPLLVCIFQCFCGLVNKALIMYRGLIVERCISFHDIFNCSFWIVLHLFKIYLLASSGHALKIEVLKIGQTLHNIPTEGQNARWFMEVQHFSSAISYKNIEMTFFGCISLDATLMYNMLCTASIYLIILIQIDKRGE
nr:gustatory receptor 38 [Papilio glaucus]